MPTTQPPRSSLLFSFTLSLALHAAAVALILGGLQPLNPPSLSVRKQIAAPSIEIDRKTREVNIVAVEKIPDLAPSSALHQPVMADAIVSDVSTAIASDSATWTHPAAGVPMTTDPSQNLALGPVREDHPDRPRVPTAPAPTGDAAATVSNPQPLASNAPPQYPPDARRRNIQGTVLLNIQVAADGTVSGIAVTTSSGSPLLDEAAINAVQQWRFQPAQRNNQPIAAQGTLPVQFKLTN